MWSVLSGLVARLRDSFSCVTLHVSVVCRLDSGIFSVDRLERLSGVSFGLNCCFLVGSFKVRHLSLLWNFFSVRYLSLLWNLFGIRSISLLWNLESKESQR